MVRVFFFVVSVIRTLEFVFLSGGNRIRYDMILCDVRCDDVT